MRVIHRARRAPAPDRMRERARRFVALAARFGRPSMLQWLRRYPQLVDHKMSSLQGRIEVRVCLGAGVMLGWRRGGGWGLAVFEGRKRMCFVYGTHRLRPIR
jgi:hypothetical protein